MWSNSRSTLVMTSDHCSLQAAGRPVVIWSLKADPLIWSGQESTFDDSAAVSATDVGTTVVRACKWWEFALFRKGQCQLFSVCPLSSLDGCFMSPYHQRSVPIWCVRFRMVAIWRMWDIFNNHFVYFDVQMALLIQLWWESSKVMMMQTVLCLRYSASVCLIGASAAEIPDVMPYLSSILSNKVKYWMMG